MIRIGFRFPRATVQLGDCVAIVRSKAGRGSTKVGQPILAWGTHVRWNGDDWSAARLSFHLNVKRVKRRVPGRRSGFILHTCDHGWCIEPSHLYQGTQQRNVHDMYERSPTIRFNLSLATKGIPKSDDWKRQTSVRQKQLWSDPKYKAKMSKAFTGIPRKRRRPLSGPDIHSD
jgi:hypothetical protein